MIDLSSGTWLNPPAACTASPDRLTITTKDKTDFWQETYYGFHRDSGHFCHWPAQGDFTASLSFDGRYEELYDQAGLMLRVDAQHWIKFGIEYSDGACNFSLVCTNGRSDWSVVRVPHVTGPQAIRITRKGGAVIADFRSGDGAWQMQRLCPFVEAAEVLVGPMACSPQREGFTVSFTDFRIDPPRGNPLHG